MKQATLWAVMGLSEMAPQSSGNDTNGKETRGDVLQKWAHKFHMLLSASWRTREADVVTQSGSRDLRIEGRDGVSPGSGPSREPGAWSSVRGRRRMSLLKRGSRCPLGALLVCSASQLIR